MCDEVMVLVQVLLGIGLIAALVVLVRAMSSLTDARRDLAGLASQLKWLSRLVARREAPDRAAGPPEAEWPPAPPEPPAPSEATPAPPDGAVAEVLEHEAAEADELLPPLSVDAKKVLIHDMAGRPTGIPPVSMKRAGEAASQDVELFIGRKLLAWVGMLALLVGSVLFIIWAHHQLLPGAAKSLIHVALGLGLLACGEWASRKSWTPLALTLTGGGIAELLFAGFSALALYDLIGWEVFLALMAVVVALAIALALRYESQTISVIAALAGVAAPIMLWVTRPDFRAVFVFLAAVDLIAVLVAVLRRWRAVTLVAFIGTALNVAFWLWRDHGFAVATASSPRGVDPAAAILVVGGFFVLFLAVSLVCHLERRDGRPADLWVFVLNPVWTFMVLHGLFGARHAHAMAGLAAAMGALHLVVAAAARARAPDARGLRSLAITLGVGFLAVAVPLRFDGLAVPILFGLLAVALYAASEVAREWRMRVAGFLVFLAMGVALLVNVPTLLADVDAAVVNRRCMTLGACALGLWASAAVIRRSRLSHPRIATPECAGVPALFAHALVLAVFTLETQSWFAHQGDTAMGHFGRQVVTSAGYALYAAGLLAAGLGLRRLYLRASGLVLFGVAALKIFIYDVAELRGLYRVASFIALALLLLLGAALYSRRQHVLFADAADKATKPPEPPESPVEPGTSGDS